MMLLLAAPKPVVSVSKATNNTSESFVSGAGGKLDAMAFPAAHTLPEERIKRVNIATMRNENCFCFLLFVIIMKP